MTLCGIEFDDPREFPPTERDYREYREGARTSVKEVWVSRYERDGNSVSLHRIPLTMTNRGAVTFDGKPVRDEAERRLAAEIFAGIKVA